MYQDLLDSFSSSFDDSDYLYSEVFPGCLKLDVDRQVSLTGLRKLF